MRFETTIKNVLCRSGDGEFHGCVTDTTEIGTKLTLPIYASYCSAFCYEKDQKNLERLERCPFIGEKHASELDPALLRTLLSRN